MNSPSSNEKHSWEFWKFYSLTNRVRADHLAPENCPPTVMLYCSWPDLRFLCSVVPRMCVYRWWADSNQWIWWFRSVWTVAMFLRVQTDGYVGFSGWSLGVLCRWNSVESIWNCRANKPFHYAFLSQGCTYTRSDIS